MGTNVLPFLKFFCSYVASTELREHTQNTHLCDQPFPTKSTKSSFKPKPEIMRSFSCLLSIGAFASIINVHALSTLTSKKPFSSGHADPEESVDWENFGFSLNGVTTESMWVSRISAIDGGDDYSKNGALCPFKPLELLQLLLYSTMVRLCLKDSRHFVAQMGKS